MPPSFEDKLRMQQRYTKNLRLRLPLRNECLRLPKLDVSTAAAIGGIGSLLRMVSSLYKFPI